MRAGKKKRIITAYKFLTAALIAASATILYGCGHNAVVYGDAVGVEAGIIPDQYKIAFSFRYGKTFTAVVKEKTKLSLTTNADNSGETGTNENTKGSTTTGVKTTLSLETGDQITGYTVKLEEAKKGTK